MSDSRYYIDNQIPGKKMNYLIKCKSLVVSLRIVLQACSTTDKTATDKARWGKGSLRPQLTKRRKKA